MITQNTNPKTRQQLNLTEKKKIDSSYRRLFYAISNKQ